MTIRSSSFATPQQRDMAIAVFVGRGYRARSSSAVLWPGELRATAPGLLEWRAKDDDPAAPLWELLQELHAKGDAERIGLALELLVDRGFTPRQVVATLLSVPSLSLSVPPSVSFAEPTCTA
jgi:hypothetical protein